MDLHICAGDYMANHPLCARQSWMVVALDISRFVLVLDRPGARCEVGREVARSATDERKGRPPVGGMVLIPMAVGKGVENGKDWREGLVCGGEKGGAWMWTRHDGCVILDRCKRLDQLSGYDGSDALDRDELEIDRFGVEDVTCSGLFLGGAIR